MDIIKEEEENKDLSLRNNDRGILLDAKKSINLADQNKLIPNNKSKSNYLLCCLICFIIFLFSH